MNEFFGPVLWRLDWFVLRGKSLGKKTRKDLVGSTRIAADLATAIKREEIQEPTGKIGSSNGSSSWY